MKLTITIDLDNAAFQPYPEVEVGRILTVLASRLDVSGCDPDGPLLLWDRNGNRVGTAKTTATRKAVKDRYVSLESPDGSTRVTLQPMHTSRPQDGTFIITDTFALKDWVDRSQTHDPRPFWDVVALSVSARPGWTLRASPASTREKLQAMIEKAVSV